MRIRARWDCALSIQLLPGPQTDRGDQVAFICSPAKTAPCYAEIRGARPPFNLRDLLRKAAGKTGAWKDDKFAEVFSELNDRAVLLTHLPLDDLRIKLRADEKLQIAQESDRIEVFGAKLRFAEITGWGLILLGSVLFYLSIHLGKLIIEVAAGAAVSPEWIGLHKTVESKAFLILSMVALPVAVAFLLVVRIWSTSARVERFAYTVGVATVLVLVASTTRRLIKLWKAIRRNPGDHPLRAPVFFSLGEKATLSSSAVDRHFYPL